MPTYKQRKMREGDDWQAIRATLTQMLSSAGRVKYISNQGNAGDALIAAGAWQFFDDCRIQPELASTKQVATGDSVIYAGGGNLVPEYTNCQRFLEQCLRVDVGRALVLPQSIRGHESLLQLLDNRFALVCRDEPSEQRVRATGTTAQIFRAPDMALYIDVPRLFARCASPLLIAQFRNELVCRGKLLPYLAWRWQLSRLRVGKDGIMHIIRNDVEAVGNLRGPARWDVSNLYGSRYRFRNEADFVARDYLAFMQHARLVRTNRLHAGIAAALMGIEVAFFDNSYGKIRAVYDASLRDLARVHFESCCQ